MRKTAAFLVVVAVVAGMVAFGTMVAIAEPSDACGSSDPVAAVQGTNSVTICVKSGPVNGALTAAGDPAAQKGYVAADGDSTNPEPLDGYIAVESGNPADNAGGLAIVGCANGDYNPSGPNNVIFGPPNPPGDPTTSPCTPAP